MLNLNSIEVVILRCPYQSWQLLDVQTHFADMIALKLAGYQKEYQYGVLPVDTTDFIANHVLIYEKLQTGKSRLVSALKSTPFHYCKAFQLEFNARTLLRHGHAKQQHLIALNTILEKCSSLSRSIAYYSSWTILPEIREKKENVRLLKDIVTALTFLHHQEESIDELLGLGVPKFKTHEYFSTWGFEAVQFQGSDLPRLYVETYSDIEVILMHLQSFSVYAKERALFYQGLWEARKTVGQSLDFSHFDKKDKAA